MAVVMEGPLSKWTNVVKGWQYRWFVLDDNTGLLSYYTSKEKMMRGARRGCLRLKGANIGIDDEEDSTFTITCDQKIFHFQARDSDEREKWIRALEDTIKRHSQPRKRTLVGFGDQEFDPSEESLGQRLAEAEAYFKILTRQVQALEQQMNNDPVGTNSERYTTLKESSAKMLETIGQSLEMMYALKGECEKPVVKRNDEKTTLPLINNHFDDKPALEPIRPHNTLPETLRQKTPDSPTSPTMRQSKSDTELNLKDRAPSLAGVEEGNLEQQASKATSKSSIEISVTGQDSLVSNSTSSKAVTSVTSSSNTQPITVPARTPLTDQVGYSISPTLVDKMVPYTSYSSSDEEAEFFDADEFHEPEVLPPRINPQPSGNGLDEDEYEVEEEDYGGREGESIEQHSSVITHLLSQVRLGMDLTKVVLPTFILERRSLLEMYADFFAHPDLFCSIFDYKDPKERSVAIHHFIIWLTDFVCCDWSILGPIVDHKDPKDRMITVTKWFLSAFHAGRKSSVAKKPYNPILGETFRCNWILPECQEHRDKPSEDGPVPWASRDDVAFIAEQVSHHPPISAFYAENPNKKIACCAHIWTKSKFLGLSVGVECVGQGCISVLPYDEEYIVTFPNGYGRSILTVPWMEIGGKTSITCAKSGYSANVQFHCKPFYGGKKHRVSCEVYGPEDSKKPFMTVAGEWNGQMHVRYGDQEPELFIDTKTMPVITKRVKKIEKQDEFESRRLWQHVTANLKVNNIEMATEHKHKLEQRQRDEAKQRKELGVAWDTKVFHEVGEHWVYDTPLQNRLARVNPLA